MVFAYLSQILQYVQYIQFVYHLISETMVGKLMYFCIDLSIIDYKAEVFLNYASECISVYL